VHRSREAIAVARAQLATETKAFITPGARMVDEIECVLSVLLAIILAHLIGARNVSWAAFSGYLVMRGHVYDSFRRGILRVAGTSTGAAIAVVTFPFIALNPIALSAAVLVIGWCSLYAALTHRHAYAFLSIGLTFVMIGLGYPESPGACLALAFTRILEVVAGTSACVVVSMVSTLTVRRQWPAQRQPNPVVAGWHADTARHATQGALALCLLPLINVLCPLPELSQAAIAIMALMLVPVNRLGSSVLVPVSRRIGLRILGCACGAALAGLTLVVAHGSVTVLIAGSLLGVMIGRHIENGANVISYGGTQLVLAVLVALVPDSYIAPNVDAGVLRLAGTLVGIAVLEPILAAFHFLTAKGVQASDSFS
jgi:Fusaric acid resistance protein family